ncbi:lipid A biosynthesis lauroyl acyltransferase [Microbulbifer sp. MLAF003]|uniref:lysophospholipid acyltransferase family protein n=1 Tax=Microbulbifer sp. MLAF003 TaxID=3032582 RepID=UPI0024ACA9F7|nr:lipid A biosynthesis lauroyl acyltransferase [Microbulbifer sp. MLAF003]WHI51230.1 lipid A biosynthesis lauroyl acyltransferase [Microbulbifer sp. MLAF003]
MDIKGHLAAGALKLIGRLPLSWSRCLGRLAGKTAVLLRTEGLRLSRINLAQCYPAMNPKQREKLARESVVNTAVTGFEMASIWHHPWAVNEKTIVSVRNQHLLSLGEEGGRGTLVLMPHTGNWEIFGMYLAAMGPSMALYQPPKIAELDPVIRGGREKTGAQMVPTNIHGVRSLLKCLKAGHVAMVLPDQEPDMGGDFAPFFGRPALTMTLAHNLLQRTKCHVVFGFGKRVEGGLNWCFCPPRTQFTVKSRRSPWRR